MSKVKEIEKKETEKLLGIEEVSKIFGLTVSFLRKAKREFGLPYYKIGSKVKFRVSEVNDWVRQRKVS